MPQNFNLEQSFFSPRRADKLNPFTVPFPIQPTSITQFPSSHFFFPPPESPHVTDHPAWILTLSQTSPFLIQFPNLITRTSKPQTNLQTPNPAHQHFLNLPFDLFTPNPQMIHPLPFLIFHKQPRHTPPLPMTVPTIITRNHANLTRTK